MSEAVIKPIPVNHEAHVEIATKEQRPRTLAEVLNPKAAPKPEVKPEEVSKIDSSRFAALAKKEREIQKMREEAIALEKDAKTKLEAYTKFEESKKRAAENPIAYLEAAGITYEQLTNFILNGQKLTPELEQKSVKDELASLRQQLADEKRLEEEKAREQADKEYQESLQKFTQEVDTFLKDNTETYELTNALEVQSWVMATIETHWENQIKDNVPESSRKMLSIKEAADLVEAELEFQMEQKVLPSKKFKSKVSLKEVKGQEIGMSASKQTTPTLTNSVTSSVPSMLPPKTESDRLARALAALNR